MKTKRMLVAHEMLLETKTFTKNCRRRDKKHWKRVWHEQMRQDKSWMNIEE